MYLTEEQSTAPGLWFAQDLTHRPAEAVHPGARVVLFKVRGTPLPGVRIRRPAAGQPQRPGRPVAGR